ncbi:MAG: hypothetical protein GF346_03785 [Candidatus Eisenbacteria bacterium]|nr:hypothetical protein [Candidatus Latescibacterota bacterium]MBD3301545.1 hypothetical protein [Candidatus Eisenbacteria bacterium]
MNLPAILALAVTQGLTEFLPISSSGHLVLANRLLGVEEPGLLTEVVLHLGTLAAVLVYFRGDLIDLARGSIGSFRDPDALSSREARRLLIALAVGTVPAVLFGLLGADRIEPLYEDPRRTSFALLFTALVLLTTLAIPRGRSRVGPARALGIGIGQALALIPGVSRSGMTIAAGLHLRVERREAARFSFLLSIPAILGAAVLEIGGAVGRGDPAPVALLGVGFLVAFGVGYGAIALMLRIVSGGRFGWFGIYCLLVGLAGLLWL